MPNAEETKTINPEKWIDSHGKILFRYAMAHLQNEALAEDCVQDTLVAALEHSHSFNGQSSELTWLTGILKHKIIDIYRKRHQITYENEFYTDENADNTDNFFDQSGHWVNAPADWGDPLKLAEKKAFRQVFETCLKKMPASLALLFSCRESLEMNTEEICNTLGITTVNSRIMLYRARLHLQGCIQTNWDLSSEIQT